MNSSSRGGWRSPLFLLGVFFLALFICGGVSTVIFGPLIGRWVVITFAVLLIVFLVNSSIAWLLLNPTTPGEQADEDGE